MRYVYLNNYRGFTKTLIPLKKVNFLVGENSTGKSSVLSVIQLMSSIRFWFDMEFNTDAVNLGGFHDIVSISSSERKFFQIGLVEEKENHQDLLILTFTDNSGRPRISKASYSIDNQIVTLRFGKTVSVKGEKRRDDRSLTEILDDITSSSNKGYSAIKDLASTVKKLPFVILMQQANMQLNLEDKPTILNRMFENAGTDEAIWMAPIRSKPKRTYDSVKPGYSPEGDHTPYLVRDLLAKKGISKEFESFLKVFGSDSGLFESLRVKNYGNSRTSPFELDVTLFGKSLSIDSVGYGVSQSLPIVVECFSRKSGSFFVIQQPEVHLHPKAQAALGDLFYIGATEKEQLFLIETHSDYLIDRYRLNFSQNEAVPSQILFFERNDSMNTVTPIEILEDGNLSSGQPESYREFFVTEELDLLKI